MPCPTHGGRAINRHAEASNRAAEPYPDRSALQSGTPSLDGQTSDSGEEEATASIGSEGAVLLLASVAVLAAGLTVALVYRKKR